MKHIWKQDIFLRTLESGLEQYDIVSFDVFDTILFRLCAEPEDVFELTGQALKQQVAGWDYAPAAYKSLRREAEQRARARKACGADCTLDEIMAEMPFRAETVAAMRRLEIHCEKQVQYLNENVYSFMRHCADCGKAVVIVSDMYHSEKQIVDFLSCAGVDTGMLARCFVSSQYGCLKSGGLFQKLREAFPDCSPDRILHIGDNLKSDVEGAKNAGIHSLHYPVVPRDFVSIYHFEQCIYGARLGALSSLRKLSAATRRCGTGPDAAAFHAFGAEVIGPVYALFAEWVVRYAQNQKVQIILPLMREGELLARVINRALRAQHSDICCAPLFVSRRPAFVAGICEETYETCISQALLRGGRTVAAFLDELGLAVSENGFACDPRCTLDDLKASGRIGELEAYLRTDTVRNTVLSYSAGQRKLLLAYMQQVTQGLPALTVDIGTKGTTERYLHDIWRMENKLPLLSHALMMGSAASNTDNILNGVGIAAWLGIAGENDRIISKIKYQIQVLETLVNATCGSVLRYAERSGTVCPVLDSESVHDRQKRMIAACWDGIEAFQEQWLSLSAKKSGLCEMLLERKTDFLSILLRAIEMPTEAEAQQIGALEYFDSFNSRNPAKLSGSMPDGGLSRSQVKGFISAELKNGVYWPQAAVAVHMPGYFVRMLLNSLGDDASFGAMLEILDEIKTKNYQTGVIFGASELGRKFQKLAAMRDVPLTCFVDSDKRLHGSMIDGLCVCAPDEAPENVEYYVIASYIYAKEIRNTLMTRYRSRTHKPILFDFGGSPQFPADSF